MTDGSGASRRASRLSRADSSIAPQRLALARKLKGWRKTELAAAVGVTPAAVTQYELGQSQPSPPVQARIALALGVPTAFLGPGMPPPDLTANAAHFRSLRATSQRERDQALAFGQIACDVLEVLETHVELPQPSLPELAVATDLLPTDVANLARQTRAALGLHSGPVPHVVRLLESHGVLVVRLPELSRRVDAFSHTYRGRPAVFLNPAKGDKARARFDAAHELGHLVMHHDAEPGSRLVENQAHSFAAEFLMPAAEVAEDLPRKLDWSALHAAKRRWGTSLKSLVFRARALDMLSEHAYRRAMMQLNVWGDPEPGYLGVPEEPSLLERAVRLLEQHGSTPSSLSDAAGLSAEMFNAVVLATSPQRPRLVVAPNSSAGTQKRSAVVGDDIPHRFT